MNFQFLQVVNIPCEIPVDPVWAPTLERWVLALAWKEGALQGYDGDVELRHCRSTLSFNFMRPLQLGGTSRPTCVALGCWNGDVLFVEVGERDMLRFSFGGSVTALEVADERLLLCSLKGRVYSFPVALSSLRCNLFHANLEQVKSPEEARQRLLRGGL